MYVETLHLSGVRNLTDVTLNCSPAINVITGKNAAGKTAILEGIHLLAKTSSFRTHRARDLIQHGSDKLTVTARLCNAENNIVITGLEKGKQQTLIKYNGEKVKKRSEQAKNLPLIAITTESHKLIYGSPRERRHWLDWSLFHVEQEYMSIWQDYHHALRQRNCLIRKRAAPSQYPSWENQLAATGVKLRALRNRYLLNLKEQLHGIDDTWLQGIDIRLQSKDETEEGILDIYRQRDSDLLAGHTQHGAHREDVLFCREGQDLGKVFSRGEGKRFITFLLLSQAREYQERCQQCPVLLVDDLPAELDEERREAMLALIENQSLQTFLTTTHAALIPVKNIQKKVFHVEHGQLVKVVE